MALQGHRAGFISRLVADALDLGVVWVIGLSVLLFAGVVRYLLATRPFQLPVLPSWQLPTGGAVIAVAYLTSGWASTGRTAGKQVAGLRVTDRSGRRLPVGRALLRAVLYVLFPVGLLWILVSRHNASVQDHIVGSVVVYDWHYHPPDESPASGDAGSPSSAPGSEQR
jgi:uncharacterized RDD family membrane protein YckC